MTIPARTSADLAQRLADGTYDFTTLPDRTAVLLDVAGHRVLTLTETAAFIVQQLCHGIFDLSDLAAAVASEYEVDPATARSDVDRFLLELGAALAPRKENSA